MSYICIGFRYNGCRYNEVRNINIMGENSGIVLTEAVYYILLSLPSPLHGYGIMQKIEDMTDGRLIISAGTLYGAINTLLERGWIKQHATTEDSRRKEYVITDEGKNVVKAELERLRELVEHGEDALAKFKFSLSITFG